MELLNKWPTQLQSTGE